MPLPFSSTVTTSTGQDKWTRVTAYWIYSLWKDITFMPSPWTRAARGFWTGRMLRMAYHFMPRLPRRSPPRLRRIATAHSRHLRVLPGTARTAFSRRCLPCHRRHVPLDAACFQATTDILAFLAVQHTCLQAYALWPACAAAGTSFGLCLPLQAGVLGFVTDA